MLGPCTGGPVDPAAAEYGRTPFTDIDIERGASYAIAAKRIDEGFLVDDLAPRDVDEHAPRLAPAPTRGPA